MRYPAPGKKNKTKNTLPVKVPVELSVALVLFFFFLLAASGMSTGWLFSNSYHKNRTRQISALLIRKRYFNISKANSSLAEVPAGPWERCCRSSEGIPFSWTPLQPCLTWPTARGVPCNRGHMEGGREGQRVPELTVVEQEQL